MQPHEVSASLFMNVGGENDSTGWSQFCPEARFTSLPNGGQVVNTLPFQVLVLNYTIEFRLISFPSSWSPPVCLHLSLVSPSVTVVNKLQHNVLVLIRHGPCRTNQVSHSTFLLSYLAFLNLTLLHTTLTDQELSIQYETIDPNVEIRSPQQQKVSSEIKYTTSKRTVTT